MKVRHIEHRFLLLSLTLCGFLFVALFPPYAVKAEEPASLFVAPSGGTFTVGSTFTVSVLVNTGGQNINALEANLRFPPDKLQVVSPTAGKSLIGIWVAQPTYDNTIGQLKFQGAIPNPGINTSQGLISQITFRVVGIGLASLRFEDSSRVLLNDGKGTDILGQTTSGIYHFVLPPPAGPIVSSPTHPDQESWYKNPNVSLEWTSDEEVQGFSYVLNDSPVDDPDDISEGLKNSVLYKNLEDGIHYFHIKALRNGSWGGVTHYALRIDASPPAAFPIDVLPAAKTVTRKLTIDFATTDAFSGVDHYEIKVIPLSLSGGGSSNEQALFVEAQSPYISEFVLGDYNVVVRAYDKAGNYAQEEQKVYVVNKIFNIFGTEGIQVRSNLVISWGWIWGVAGFLLLLCIYLAHLYWERHHHVHEQLSRRELPQEIQKQLQELKNLKDKYRGLSSILLLILLGGIIFFASPVRAADSESLSPPVITLVSQNISNEEIFYVGGKVEAPQAQIILYLQNLENGETLSYSVTADNSGNWFYSHSRFLSRGSYLLWGQAKIAGESSPPSPQVKITVSQTAVQLGASRLSYEVVYLIVSVILLVLLAIFASVALYHARQHREKHGRLREEVRKAEESVKRGFAVLKRDIEAELALVRRSRTQNPPTPEARDKEDAILKDLERIKNYIGKEMWEIDRDLE